MRYCNWPSLCSGKSVKLTIWGSLAETDGAELESLSHPVVSVTACRVGDYDGLSLLHPPNLRALQLWRKHWGFHRQDDRAQQGILAFIHQSRQLITSVHRCVDFICEQESAADQS